jgi:drug/metabolite transporter (DMT)-like permease
MERWLTSERNVRLCAMLGAVAIAFSSILVRLSHASPSTAAIFRCVYALPVLGLLTWREDRRLGSRSWADRRWAVAAGVFFAADLIMWHHSIGDIGAGLATVLANAQVALVPLVAWALLAERPSRHVLAALPIALLGVLLISGVLEHGAYGHDPTRGTIFGLGAGVAYTGFLLMLRHGGADLRHRTMPRARHPASPEARRPIHPVAGPLFDATATGAVGCVIAGLIIGDANLVPQWPGAGWLVTLALTSQVVGWLLITSSLPRLPAALTSLLLTIQPVGSVALAAVILAEAPSVIQLLGVVLVLAALLVATRQLAAGGRAARRLRYALLGASDDAAPASADAPDNAAQAIAGASGSRPSAAAMSSSENSGSSSRPARKAS